MKASVPLVAMGMRVSQQGRGPKRSKMRQISRGKTEPSLEDQWTPQHLAILRVRRIVKA